MALVNALRAACTKQGPVVMMQQNLLKLRPMPSVARRALTTTAPLRAAGAGSHSTLWTVERAVSAGLLFALPAAIAFPSQPLDYIVAVSTVMHAHWGLEACVVDYARPIVIGKVLPKVAHGLLLAFSAATLGGLVYFIQNDVGIGNAVRQLWSIKAKAPPAQQQK